MDKTEWEKLVDDTIRYVRDYSISKILVSSAFVGCTNLEYVSFEKANEVCAFTGCRNLIMANFPEATKIQTNAFANCVSLRAVNIPMVTDIGSGAFGYCEQLSTIRITNASSGVIYPGAFAECLRLESLYLPAYYRLSESEAFLYTPIGGNSSITGRYGSIYVPSETWVYFNSSKTWEPLLDRFVFY